MRKIKKIFEIFGYFLMKIFFTNSISSTRNWKSRRPMPATEEPMIAVEPLNCLGVFQGRQFLVPQVYRWHQY